MNEFLKTTHRLCDERPVRIDVAVGKPVARHSQSCPKLSFVPQHPIFNIKKKLGKPLL